MKTVRRRSGQACVGLRASLTRGDLDEQAQDIAEAYVQWESQPLILPNGARLCLTAAGSATLGENGHGPVTKPPSAML